MSVEAISINHTFSSVLPCIIVADNKYNIICNVMYYLYNKITIFDPVIHKRFTLLPISCHTLKMKSRCLFLFLFEGNIIRVTGSLLLG